MLFTQPNAPGPRRVRSISCPRTGRIDELASERRGTHAFYAGSFDPPTNGHLWMVERAASLFQTITVAVGTHGAKRPAFSGPERVLLLQGALSQLLNVRIIDVRRRFVVHEARAIGATVLVRGIRTTQDYEDERILARLNATLAPEITTVVLLPPPELADLSSSLVRGIVGFAGWEDVVRPLVPPDVLAALVARQAREEESHGHAR